MPPRLNPLAARKALLTLRQPSSISTSLSISGSNGSTTSRRSMTTTLNAGRLNPSFSVFGSLDKQQRRLNSSNSDPGNEPEQKKETVHHLTPEEGAEIEEGIKKSEGTPGSPEQEQGSPISEVLKRDEKAKQYAPKVMQDQMQGPKGARSFSTSSKSRKQELQGNQPSPDDVSAAVVANMISKAIEEKAEELQEPGIKFHMPQHPLPKTENFRTRYDSLLEQFTKLLMRDGKLSKAQKDMSFILDHLRTASPPSINPKRRLLPGPPAPQLPLNPVLYLSLIVDSVAPLIKIRQQKGIAGGGAALQIPVPLFQRQRRRTAIRWIIDASDKRRDSKFALRVANELIAVAEGRSGVWEKREHVHKIGVAGRSNLGVFARR